MARVVLISIDGFAAFYWNDPRVKIPTLLLGGRQDLAHPLETAQKPFFQLLGTPEKDKRHYVFEGGHIAPRIEPIIKEILDWLDRYLGPVRARPG